MEKEIKQYKGYDGKSIKVGDEIEKVGIADIIVPIGKVISMRKQGFYVFIRTDKYPNQDIWGKFTRKVTANAK